MTHLSQENFAKARDFLLTKGRPLEQAALRFTCADGSRRDVEKALKTYQNDDGGFGRALEPDVRLPASSVLATVVAFQHIRAYGLSDKAMITAALDYLHAAYSDELPGWVNLPAAAKGHPHAQWWNHAGEPESDWGNPNAEVLGYLLEFGEALPAGWLGNVTDLAITHLREASKLAEMHELLCYLRLAESLAPDLRALIQDRLDQYMANCVKLRQQHGDGYFAEPLQFVKSPDALYHGRYAGDLPGELDVLVASQGEDGAWGPNWSWNQYTDAWPAARQEWQSTLSMDALRTLHSFQRIAGAEGPGKEA